MSFLVPDKIIASEGEKTIRQYKCAKLYTSKTSLNATIAVTNRRVILYADNGNKKNPQVYQKETFIDNISGVTFFNGVSKKPGNFAIYFVMFLLSATIAGLCFWQAESIYNFAKFITAPLTIWVKLLIALVPLVLYLIISLLTRLGRKKQIMQFIIHTRGFANSNVALYSSEAEDLYEFCVVPNSKESKRLISEISSIILDIQQYGAENVLKHIDADI